VPETEPVSDCFDLHVEPRVGEQFDQPLRWARMVDDREASSVVERAFFVLGRHKPPIRYSTPWRDIANESALIGASGHA
jgi:hypothetical protein